MSLIDLIDRFEGRKGGRNEGSKEGRSTHLNECVWEIVLRMMYFMRLALWQKYTLGLLRGCQAKGTRMARRGQPAGKT